jgi:hypothetical protein
MASSQLIARHARETSGKLAPAAHFAKFESRCIDRLARSIGDLQDIVRNPGRSPEAGGCTTIRSEKKSGTSTPNREELRTVLDSREKRTC